VHEFGEATRAWFDTQFPSATAVQREGWPRIAAGENALLVAPTGSGKTLAAFLWCIDRLVRLPESAPPGVRVVYVSPLKALVYDIERNLRVPLAGIEEAARARGEAFRRPRIAVRTGDTTQKERRAQSRDPAEILVTTPESLYLILGSRQRETLARVDTLVVDEIHALAPTKRGAHLALSLERAATGAARDPQRIGLSATAEPLDEVARFLGGDREVCIVDARVRPHLDLEIRVPVPDMENPGPGPAESQDLASDPMEPRAGLWPVLYPKLLEAIQAHASTIVFVNSRGLCERLTRRLNELAGEELVHAHHGSIAHDKRSEIEEALKAGQIRGIVATSSLELGVDMGAVDLVLLVESPGSVSRGLQRVGRSGHRVGETSLGRIFPKHRGDLLEACVVARGMQSGDVEPLRLPRNPLDVLAQQVVAMCAAGEIRVDDLEKRVRRAANYRDLSREALCGVLDMLAGRYPSTDFSELRPRIVWDRERDLLSTRPGANQIALVSGGTIPDRGQYAVHLGSQGPRIGELDEEMVHETRAGQIVTLGASSWRVDEITRDRVVVKPAPGEIGRLPFWRGEGPGRPAELGRALGALLRECERRDDAELEAWLRDEHLLDGFAARNLAAYVREQREATGVLPTDESLVIERFRDELGDWRICIHSPFGMRVNAPLALAIEARLEGRVGFEVQTLWSDDGIVLRFADAEGLPDVASLVPEPGEVEELVIGQLGHSALFASQFRENAARALLLPRRRPGSRTPLWAQRLRAQNLLAVARRFPSFPIVLETYRSCLQDSFDLPGLVGLLEAVQAGSVRVVEAETRSASPFARSLVFAYTAAYLYQGDVPLAERRAQALHLDRHLLRDLLGQDDLRQLLDASVLERTEAELQGRADGFQARGPHELHDLLRRVGDLETVEIRERCQTDPDDWLAELERAKRLTRLRIGGSERWIAAEDAGLYRDALGVRPASGLPAAFLASVPEAMEQLVTRYARSHGPFETRPLASRYGQVEAHTEAILVGLEARERLRGGGFHPSGEGHEWCDPDVLRRLRRRTLTRLRSEVAAVEGVVLARFLASWHGVRSADAASNASGAAREPDLGPALRQLEGLPVSFAELERVLLPARVPGFQPRLLDERGALGDLVWVGRGALGSRDGRIALYERDHAGLLLDPADPPTSPSPVARRLLDHLEERGASFFGELVAAGGGTGSQEIEEAVWELVWAGLLTNDTFAPLRALAARRRTGSPRTGRRSPRRRAVSAAGMLAGRWSLVSSLLRDVGSPTERAHARAVMLLERWGVLSRDAAGLELLPGGFACVYPVLQVMEESGRLRRGHFALGLSGAQFAYAGVVDRLRIERALPREPVVTLLAATDPANPYGGILPWPELRFPGCGSARRAVGSRVVAVNGVPVLYLEAQGRSLLSFEAAADPELRSRAARALSQLVAGGRRRSLRVQRIDSEVADRAELAEALVQAGFRRDYNALVLEREAGTLTRG